ncbi:helix-turn-helix domain-containing protein [Paenibacillus sp. YN15]|uniref:AraC family transcriptional regulator n=1 Tax=Paenibacillus sp. YN15 TaxID=1742774 RepID=UPI000DCCEDA1|nr:helix-turn-helix domain-containing protein [Paenibacillus sp. YN15]RAU98887.1 AraC family transcriptional regulator [Paenibacillus sp. YN15]
MDWVERMNQAIGYVEEHLNGGMDTEEIARIMACPFTVFQRSFIEIAGMPLSEYIRFRKLSRAAYDLQNSGEKVIDIALKYGYESADAFTAAFKRLHGVSPATARKEGVKLAFYGRLQFELTIKGASKMDYRLVRREEFQVMGKRSTTPFGGGTWAIVKSDGSADALQKISGHFVDLGLCFGFGEDGSNDYMCGVEWAGANLPDFELYRYPAAPWLVFEAAGAISAHVLNMTWQRIHQEFLPQSKYKLSGLPTIEKYVSWDDAADRCQVEIWLPVALK